MEDRLNAIDKEIAELHRKKNELNNLWNELKQEKWDLLLKKHEWIWTLNAKPIKNGIGHLAGVFSSYENAEKYLLSVDQCNLLRYRYEIEKRRPTSKYDFDEMDRLYPDSALDREKFQKALSM